MRFYYASDLHLEFEYEKHTLNIPNDPQAILILAGDTYNIRNYDDNIEHTHLVYRFFQECSQKFKKVLIIPGNHESYGSDIASVIHYMTIQTEDFENVIVCDGDMGEIEGVPLFAKTFWTDMNNNNPMVLYDAGTWMNDYRYIKNGHMNFRPDDSVVMNNLARCELMVFLNEYSDRKKIIVTHHALSEICTQDQYKGELLNYAYVNTGLEDTLMASGEFIAVHGHLHTRARHELIGGTILSNARGYKGYPDTEGFDFAFFEID